ncbi:hypothetical protein J6590_082476 [Homalodisca vitripennis]|nr:hypothetical protein J6590_082476 [Homalodisca vitripennis]
MMQRALTIVERWSDEEGLAGNCSKTVIIAITSMRILEITQPVLCGDQIQVTDCQKAFQVDIVEREEWSNSEPVYMKKALAWYTDRSMTPEVTGAGVWGVRSRAIVSFILD